ncbi:DNA/RNA non-specific endonuclease [Campylobacter sp. RM12651]|uniref:DNA/RNA non-specific endonuclease n=1 Tax=Campylobacter sp. RM12651 TaxID=1660079 RepID=UPI001EFA83E4|nr:DNA/RNA non-specific endonuclease [Campylobacter sp. RM12651]ULO03841.1 DNA/RNA endonuclease G [Campylobacter sp. RM12651]
MLKKTLITLLVVNSFLYANGNANYEQYVINDKFKPFFRNCDQLLDKYYYVNCYNYKLKSSIAVAYKLKKENLETHIKKRPKFEEDFELPKKHRTRWSDYLHSGYDRGHILSNQSMNATKGAQRSTFLMSNITPQVPEINRKVFLKAEKFERLLAINNNEVEVLNLIKFNDFYKTISKTKIAVPQAYIKILITNNDKYCFYIPNNQKFEDYKLKDLRINCENFFQLTKINQKG